VRAGGGGRSITFSLVATLLALGARPTLAAPLASAVPQESDAAQARPVVVASKPFAESFILAELFAGVLEARGIPVERRLGLGATEIAFQALRTGAIDVYPEYTGTGLLALLGETPSGDAGAVFRRVSRAFLDRWALRWLPPLGFENTYAVAVRRATADSLGLATLSDLAREGAALIGGFSPDFLGRDDGLPGLEATYGLALADVRPLLQAVKYSALAEGAVDVIDGYSTDGAIARLDLVVLRDDRSFFPPYEAAALIGPRLASDEPGAVAALTELSGRLDAATVRAANARVEVEGADPATVAREILVELGLVAAIPGTRAAETADAEGAFLPYLWGRRAEIARLTLRHLQLVGVSLLFALLVAIPLGLLMERLRTGAEGVIRGVGLLQTVPSIALLAFMIPLLGIGFAPAVVALFLYSLLPIVRNTYTGVRDADPVAVAAAVALGMTPRQALLEVRLPLAAPVILAGVRTAAVINVGTATLAAFIGAGGLGDPIVAGLALSDTRLILSGALPAAALALLVDGGLEAVERRLTPRGLEAS
jgi:osmoprotectant transport system permease protein